MALGGGSFTVQNKVLPGAYINFVSAASASSSLSDRGVCTMPLELDWGEEGKIFKVTGEEFLARSMEIFGYPQGHERMRGLADLFRGASVLYAYRLNGGGSKAANTLATALYGGKRGNDLKTAVQANADAPEKFDVITYMGESKVDSQTVAAASELMANGYVEFHADVELVITAATPLTGGTNGTVDGKSHQAYLDAVESYTYNTMGVVVADETAKKLYVAFNRRMRDEMGIKFQLVLYGMPADYMGVISVKNRVTDEGWPEESLVYWVTGMQCGCAVNRSVQNRQYDGTFRIDTAYTQAQLAACIREGSFVLHNVNDSVRVLEDINSMVTTTDTEGDVFKDNQAIRVIDQIANDLAVLFCTKYLGNVPNNNAGRVSLWSDIVAYHRQLEQIRAIEGFSDTDITVRQGGTKKSVEITDSVTIVSSMSQLYMLVTVA